jgi:hypothetical protein
MDETIRRDNSGDTYNHPASNRNDADRGDDILLLFRRSETEKKSLTKREREERWPIG